MSFAADGASINDTESSSSDVGAPGKSSSGDTATDSSGKDTNAKADDNLKLGNDQSTAASGKDSGSSKTPKANTGDSSGGTTVTVAAAVPKSVPVAALAKAARVRSPSGTSAVIV